MVLEEFQNEVQKVKKDGIQKEHFERIKNMLYGNAVKEFNSVSRIARMFVADYFKGVNSFDYIEEYKLITEEYTKQILDEVFVEDNTVISIVKGK